MPGPAAAVPGSDLVPMALSSRLTCLLSTMVCGSSAATATVDCPESSRYDAGHGAFWKLDQASGWKSRPGRHRSVR